MLDSQRPVCAVESCDSARVAAVGPLIFGGLTEGFDRLFLRSQKLPNGCIVVRRRTLRSADYYHFGAYGLTWPAHRLAFEFLVGPIPVGLFVCHRCDYPPCINPVHLFVGTNADNMADQVAKGRSVRGENHPRSKVTAHQVYRIRARIEAGESPAVVALDYGISRLQAFRIYNRTTWAHLPEQPQATGSRR